MNKPPALMLQLYEEAVFDQEFGTLVGMKQMKQVSFTALDNLTT